MRIHDHSRCLGTYISLLLLWKLTEERLTVEFCSQRVKCQQSWCQNLQLLNRSKFMNVKYRLHIGRIDKCDDSTPCILFLIFYVKKKLCVLQHLVAASNISKQQSARLTNCFTNGNVRGRLFMYKKTRRRANIKVVKRRRWPPSEICSRCDCTCWGENDSLK